WPSVAPSTMREASTRHQPGARAPGARAPGWCCTLHSPARRSTGPLQLNGWPGGTGVPPVGGRKDRRDAGPTKQFSCNRPLAVEPLPLRRQPLQLLGRLEARPERLVALELLQHLGEPQRIRPAQDAAAECREAG